MAKKSAKKIVASGMSPNLQAAVDGEEVNTERSDRAESLLMREYYYHMLRAEELREFLYNCGHGFPGFDD